MPGARPGRIDRMGRIETKTKSISPYDVQLMRRTMNTKAIAEHYNITPSALWKWAKRHNVILDRVTDWELAEGIWDKTPKELAYEYNVPIKFVYSRLRRMGICTRQDGQNRRTK